ncbi:hypothetical protein ABW21_db0205605 [Orbilia brochopaga]|nr:hypothetical protein ABW21_db0205605 [Drechslerella brochopaga]
MKRKVTSSQTTGQWWAIDKIIAERGRGEKKQYLVEWEGTDSQGEPWPADWKYAYDIDSTAIDEWEEQRRRRKRALSSSPSGPLANRQTKRPKSRTASLEVEDHESRPKKLRPGKGIINSPIVISSSPDEIAVASNATTDSLSVQPRPRNKRRRILESSQSTGQSKGTQVPIQAEDDIGEEDGDDLAEDAAHHDPSASEYIVRPTPEPSPIDDREEEKEALVVERPFRRPPIIIPLRPEGPYVSSSQEGSRPPSTAASIQVPRTQIPRRARRVVPDSQSSRATSIYLTPADQRIVVPETPFERLAGRVNPPAMNDDTRVSAVAPNLPPSSSLLEDDFADIPDSSNRVFSQDVKELKHQEASQSQSSKDSQKTSTDQSRQSQNSPHQSQNSMPSAQLSFGKIGVAPSTKASSDRESPVSASGGSATSSRGQATVAPHPAAKSVAVVHAAPPSSLDFDQQPQTELRPQPQPRSVAAHDQDDIESASSSYITSKANHRLVASREQSAHSTNSLLNRIDRIAKADTFSLGILQEAVESRRPAIVDTPSEPSAQLPQQLEGDTTKSTDSSSLHHAKSVEIPVGTEALLPALLSPKTPIREEDALQGGRSATTTPCGPIPASARPAPVTVLGYLPQKAGQNVAENEEPLPSSAIEVSVLPTSTTLNQIITSRRRQERPSPPPLRETRSTTRRKRKSPTGEDIMPAAPLSPLLNPEVPAPIVGSSPRRQTRDRSTSHPASPPPAPNNPDGHLSIQDSDKGHRMDIQFQGTSPVAVDSPSIDDDLLAGSQVLRLIRGPVESTPDEICLAIPLNDIQKILYKQALLENYRRVEAFFGIEKLEYGKTGPKLVKWFCKQSSKFDLLSKVLEKLKDDEYTVALVAENGRLMECLDIFMRSTGYSFTRYSEAISPVTPLPEENRKGLHVILIPSNRVEDNDIALPTANIIIGFDSTLDSSSLQIKRLRSNGTAATPIIHFVPVNTVAHIILCLPESARSSRRDYINATLFAAMLIRKHVGVLPGSLSSHLDELPNTNAISWLEGLRNAPDGLLPALQLDSQSSQNSGNAELHDPEMISSPSRKRVLSFSVTPAAASGKHKKPRVESPQTSGSQTEDTPMDDFDNTADKHDIVVEVEDSRSGEQASSIPNSAEQTGDITHVTSTMPNESSRNKKPLSTAANQENSTQDTKDTASREQAANPLEDSQWLNREDVTDEEVLKHLSKEDLIELLLDCKAKYTEARNESRGFETALSVLQLRHEERRQRVRDLKAEVGTHAAQSRAAAAESHLHQTIADNVKAERDRAKLELQEFQKALSDRPEGERMRAQMFQELNDLKTRFTTSSLKHKQTERDLDFARDRYLNESRQNMTLLRENEELEEQVELWKRAADETKVRLKEVNLDRERTKYQNKIKELQSKLDKASKHNIALDAEKKRAERSRGLQTRSSSIPPRPPQSSPVPTRSASPTTSHRHPLRGVDSA